MEVESESSWWEYNQIIGGHGLAVSGRRIPVEDIKDVMEVAEPQVGVEGRTLYPSNRQLDMSCIFWKQPRYRKSNLDTCGDTYPLHRSRHVAGIPRWAQHGR